MIPIDQGGGGYTPRSHRFPKTKLSFRSLDQYSSQISLPISVLRRLRGSCRLGWLQSLVVALFLLPASVLAQAPTPSDAIAFEQQQKWPEAAQAWKAVTARNPNDAAAFAALGVDLARLQKYDEAAMAYRKALSLNPKLPGIQLNLGLAEYKQQRWAAAATAFRAALAADPKNTQAQTLLGMSYYASRKFDLAAQYLDPASKADPANAELHQKLAESCLWAKKAQCAMEEFRILLQQTLSTPVGRFALSVQRLMEQSIDDIRVPRLRHLECKHSRSG